MYYELRKRGTSGRRAGSGGNVSCMTPAQRTSEIFAANRAVGRIMLAVKSAGGATRRARVHEQGALRVRCPGQPGPEAEAVIVNTAGGMAGGDRFEIDVTVECGARLAVTTAAAEKVYRTLGPDTVVAVTAAVADRGELAWLPQETILFDRARLRRTIDVDLAADARLLLAEAVVFGRSGMGEAVEHGLFFDRWRIRRDGRLIYAETARLNGPIRERFAERAVTNGGIAIATVLLVPGDDAVVAAVRALRVQGEVGTSAWNGLAVVRLVAADGAALRADLSAVLTAVRGTKLPRLWLN
jgi:urease accessory protein